MVSKRKRLEKLYFELIPVDKYKKLEDKWDNATHPFGFRSLLHITVINQTEEFNSKIKKILDEVKKIANSLTMKHYQQESQRINEELTPSSHEPRLCV